MYPLETLSHLSSSKYLLGFPSGLSLSLALGKDYGIAIFPPATLHSSAWPGALAHLSPKNTRPTDKKPAKKTNYGSRYTMCDVVDNEWLITTPRADLRRDLLLLLFFCCCILAQTKELPIHKSKSKPKTETERKNE